MGLGVCSHGRGTLETAVFSKVELSSKAAVPAVSTVARTLETMDIESGDRKVVLPTKDAIEAPNWSRDGKTLIFNKSGRLYRLPVEGGEPEPIDTGAAIHCNNDHGLSPDGSQLAISNDPGDGRASVVYTLPSGGGEPKLITPKGPSYWHGWSPDGRTLAYVGRRDGEFDIYAVPATGGEEVRADDLERAGRRARLFRGRPLHLLQLLPDGPHADLANEGRWLGAGAAHLRQPLELVSASLAGRQVGRLHLLRRGPGRCPSRKQGCDAADHARRGRRAASPREILRRPGQHQRSFVVAGQPPHRFGQLPPAGGGSLIAPGSRRRWFLSKGNCQADRRRYARPVLPSLPIRCPRWLSAACLLAAVVPGHAQVEFVDPTIGGVGFLLVPTRPVVHLPNSMVRVYPTKPDQLEDQISAFPLTIRSYHRDGLFAVMPSEKIPSNQDWDLPQPNDLEKTTPYYYATRLDDSLIQIEFTPTARCGFFRFTFPGPKQRVLLGGRLAGEVKAEGENAVSGIEPFLGMTAYFYGEFNGSMDFQKPEGAGEPGRLAATPKEARKVVEFRYGISFISVEQARKNLENEIGKKDFDLVREEAKKRWNEVLGQVVVEGGTEKQKKVFYTALYRSYERMINITEDGRYYSAYDHQVHADKRPFYVDNAIWDNYQALEPLHTILNPEMEADKIDSYIRMYEQQGWMPSFGLLYGEHAGMNGNHAAPWIADAWFKGVRDYDLEKAYEGLRKNSLEATLLPWRNGPKTSLDDFYAGHGYFPSLKNGEVESVPEVHKTELRQSVAVTLENSFDDWCIAQLAGQLGRKQDQALFLKRAAFYKNVYRADKGFMWPKDSDGQWIEGIDPKIGRGQGGRMDFDENNAYTYNWSVRHDWNGLFGLMGGRAAAERKLDELFHDHIEQSKFDFFHLYPDSTGLVGQFVAGNEPSFPIPYLYTLTGSPWKTQKRIRQVLEDWFTDGLFGIPGDEDGGGMTSFAVFSMMGFFPLVPGVPAYTLGSPVFDRVTIKLHNGKTIEIVAKNNSRDNKYIQSFTLNGRPSDRLWFRHADIVNGGTLELQMGDTPNKTLGTREADAPPSSMALNPVTLE